MENPKKYLRSDGIFDYAAVQGRWWLFVDWNKTLDREAPIQGVIIYNMKHTHELAKISGKENECRGKKKFI